MLVKIVALGLSPAIWKTAFHHLRSNLPEHPFAAGIFSAADELAYLAREFFPHQWRREGVDFVLTDLSSGGEWSRRLVFLRKLSGEGLPPAALVLTLATLDEGIKQLVREDAPVELQLDRQSRYALSDPELIISTFPKSFPRIRVNEHITSLRLHKGNPAARDLTPSALPPGTLLGLGEIESIASGGKALSPEQWLHATLRAEKAHLPRGVKPGLLREPKGLFLCPGLPASQVTSVSVGGVTFSHLLELENLGEESPHFCALRDALRKASTRHKRRWRELSLRTRHAETMTDLQVVCAGGLPLLRDGLAERLRTRGFARCMATEAPEEGTFREPALLLQVGPWEGEGLGAQLEEPLRVPVEDELLPPLIPLDALLDWRTLAYRPVNGDGQRLDAKSLRMRGNELALRERKAREGLTLAENRMRLLEQEGEVLNAAQARLTELLEAHAAMLVWTGSLPEGVRQALVFSHDQEEAGAVLHALVGVSKKRWFDLSPYTSADALSGMSLEPLKRYMDGGVMVITAASRDKLRRLQESLGTQHAETLAAVTECREALGFYRQERDRLASAKEGLALRWVRDSLDAWLDARMPALQERLLHLRRRHERSWFSRALVNRVAVVASSPDNRRALLAACRELYPGFNAEHSRAVQADFQPLDELSAVDRKAVRDALGAAPLPAEAQRAKLDQALSERNRQELEAYLGAIGAELEHLRADLLIIEQQRETAFAILEHVRRAVPALRQTPAILVLPESWGPQENSALPWPRTRVVSLLRLGPLAAEDCTRHLRGLYSA